MSRLWWISAGGLFLGVVLFALAQRGCSSERADASAARQSAADFRRQMVRSAPGERDPAQPTIRERLEFQSQQNDPRFYGRPETRAATPRASDVAAAEKARQRARELRDKNGTPSSMNEIIKRRQAQQASRSGASGPRSYTTTGGSRLFAGAQPAISDSRIDDARRRFLRDMDRGRRNRDPRLAGFEDQLAARDAQRAEGAEGLDGERSDSQSDAPKGDAVTDAIQQALNRSNVDPALRGIVEQALSSLNSGNGLRNVGSNLAGAGSAVGTVRTTGSRGTTTGTGTGTGNGSGNGNGSGSGNGGNTGGVGSGGNSGGSSGGDRDNGSNPPPPPPPLPLPVIAHWVPASAPSDPNLRSFRTWDIYLSFTNRAQVFVLSSSPQLGLAFDGGRVYQDTSVFGANTPPTADILDFRPILAADSFLTLGGQTPSFTPGGEPSRDDWGSRLSATWFSVTGALAQQDRARFGDDRHYLWVGRITAGGPRLQVAGALFVNYIDLTTGRNVANVAPVLNCAACWQGATGEVAPADIESVAFASSSVASGAVATGVVTLRSPAPPGGFRVLLTSSDPLLTVQRDVLVRQGERTASFTAIAGTVQSAKQVFIRASDGRRTVESPVTVAPVGVATLVFSPAKARPGQTVTATINLNAPATQTMTAFVIGAEDNTTDFPARVSVLAGASTATFQVRVPQGATPGRLYFMAAINGDGARGAFGSLEIERIPADLTADGRVDARDLAQLLGSWGPCAPGQPCPADLNGDGLVNAADNAILLGSWGNDGTGSTPGGGNGGGDQQPAIFARWIPVDNDTCGDAAFANHRTADLFISFRDRATVLVMNSGGANALKITGGAFYQARFGTNAPPEAELVAEFPCLAVDTYMALDGDRNAPLSFTPGASPANNWGAALSAGWFTTSFSGPGGTPGVRTIQDPERFGDNRHYIRIARVSAPAAAIVDGKLEASYIGASGQTFTSQVVSVPDWAEAAASLDLNRDGDVDAADVGIVARSMGASGEMAGPADVNGDGVVNGEDLSRVVDGAAKALR